MNVRPASINRTFLAIVLPSIVILSLGALAPAADSPQDTPRPKVVKLQSSGGQILPVLTGPPETVRMKSGYVVLAAGHSVGKHSTQRHEEVLVVLEGKGVMLFKDGSSLPVEANSAVYCPPETEHDVRNAGSGLLRYVYIVASTD